MMSRGVAQMASARRSGRRGRRFESCHPDNFYETTERSMLLCSSSMTILIEDQNTLVLRDKNLLAFFLGAVSVGVGLMIVLQLDVFTSQPPVWSGSIGILLGIVVILVTKITTVTLDKSTKKLLFQYQSLTGKKTVEYQLDQIKELELTATFTHSRTGSGYSYHVSFVLVTGEVIPLNLGTVNILRVMGRHILTEKSVGAKIAHFLQVPFQERRPPTVHETLSAVSSTIQTAVAAEIQKKKQD